MAIPEQIASLASAVQAVEGALLETEDALRVATDLIEQDYESRVYRLSHQALTVRLAAAERTIARLTVSRPDSPPETPRASRAVTAREYDIQTRDPDGTWSWCAVSHEDRQTATGIAAAVARSREKFPGEQYRAVYRDLPAWQPLTDAELDALVLAEPTAP